MYSAKVQSCIFFICMWQTLSCSENTSYQATVVVRQGILNGIIQVNDGIDQIINHYKDDAKKVIQQLEKEQKYFIKDFERMSQDLGAVAKKRMERICADCITRLYEEIDKRKRIVADAATTRERIVQGVIGAGLLLLGYALFAPKTVPQQKKDVPDVPKTEPIKPQQVLEKTEIAAPVLPEKEEQAEKIESEQSSFFSKPEQKKPSMPAPEKKWEGPTFLASMLGLLYSEFLLILGGDVLSSYLGPAVIFAKSGIPVPHPSIGIFGAAAYVQAALIKKYAETMTEADVQRLIKRTDPLFLR